LAYPRKHKQIGAATRRWDKGKSIYAIPKSIKEEIKMKMKLIMIATLALFLTSLMPGSALAASSDSSYQEFFASGVITGISEGEMSASGNSDQWKVVEREIYGEFFSGDLQGDYVMVYTANVSLSDQSGTLSGTLFTQQYEFKVNGNIEPVVFNGEWYMPPDPDNGIAGIPYLELIVIGNWAYKGGGILLNGDFDAWLKFIPTPDGHVLKVVDSLFTMIGKCDLRQ